MADKASKKKRTRWLGRPAWRARNGRHAPAAAAVQPGDIVLLSRFLDSEPSFLETDDPVELGHVVAASVAADRPAREVAARLVELGYQVPDVPPEDVNPGDEVLVSLHFTGWPAWLPAEKMVPVDFVLRAAAVTRRTPADVTARLAAVGYQVPDSPPATAVNPEDIVLLSRFLDGEPSWLEAEDPVELGHVVAASVAADRPAREVAARLVELGYQVPDVPPEDVNPGDEVLVSLHFTGWPAWLPAEKMVPVDFVLRAAAVTRRTPADVTARLAAVGYQVPDSPPATAVNPEDIVLLSRFLDGEPSWLEAEDPVPASHVRKAATATGLSRGEVAARLTALGLTTA
ncbi:hypothetical protein [Kitasatospora sp. NPDC017646]|uniref:wHTH domain-containing protein n=1 Tax=Kitasatospora sp. NPDC017646 TaxID=3364024 RepID=UPI0037994048